MSKRELTPLLQRRSQRETQGGHESQKCSHDVADPQPGSSTMGTAPAITSVPISAGSPRRRAARNWNGTNVTDLVLSEARLLGDPVASHPFAIRQRDGISVDGKGGGRRAGHL